MTAPAFARIECNEASESSVYWAMAVVLPLLGFGALWIFGVPLRFNVPAREFNPLVMIPVVASLAGLFSLLVAIFATLRVRRFGVSVLTLAVKPRVGGHLRGRISSTREVAASEWRLVFRCIESIRISSGSASGKTRQDIERWKFETTMPGGAWSSDGGLAVDIAIPDDALALHDAIERARQYRGRLSWVLSLRGKRDGLDYLASFEIPIRATDPARSQA